MHRRGIVKIAAALLLSQLWSPVVFGADKVINVVWQDFTNTGREEFFTQMNAEFEAMHPGTKVVMEYGDWSNYAQKYLTRAAAGVAPDVMNLGSSGLGDLVEQGLFLPIDSYMNKWSGLKDLVPPAIVDITLHGKMWAVPYRLDVRSLLYRTDMFEDSGLDSRKPPTTWDELRSAARRLVRAGADGSITRKGYDVRNDWSRIIPFVFQAGADVYREDLSTDLNSRPVADAMSFMHDLIYVDRVSTLTNGDILAGTTAMSWETTKTMRLASQTKGIGPEDIGVAMPTKKAVQTTAVLINKLGISNQSKNPELAFDWIAYLMEPKNLAKVAVFTGSMSSRISPSRLSPFTDDARWDTWFKTAVLSRAIPGSIPYWSIALGAFGGAVSDILNDKTPVESRLAQAANDVNTQVAAALKNTK